MREWMNLRSRLDREGMFEKIRDLPEQITDALRSFPGGAPEGPFGSAVILGMGGSAIGGEIARAAAGNAAAAPIHSVRGYEAPGWCGRGSLAIAVSYSGNTEETLAASEDAAGRGATVAVVSSGGALAEWAERRGFFRFPVPEGFPPRAAIGWLTAGPLLLLERAGLLDGATRSLEGAGRALEELRPGYTGAEGSECCEPIRIAQAIRGTFPVIYYAAGETDPAAVRWCGQLAENAKTLSHRASFPELNHNEIVGWSRPEELFPLISLLLFRSDGDPPRTRKGMEVAVEMIRRRAARFLPVKIEGADRLERIFRAVYLGDFVSYYLALAGGVDPTPVEPIDVLKEKLSAGGGLSRTPGEGGRRRT